MVNAQNIVDLLNDAYKIDPAAISSLFQVRRVCNKTLGDHPHVEVFGATAEGPFMVTLIGLINGVLRSVGSEQGVIMILDDNKQQNVLGFQVANYADLTPPIK
jgi:hypothetical protein